MNRRESLDLDRHITGNYGEDSVPPDGMCIWEECDQEAMYCPGHALQYADVTSEHEAEMLRTLNRDMLDMLYTLLPYVEDAEHNPVFKPGIG